MKKNWELTLSEGIKKISDKSMTATDWINSIFAKIKFMPGPFLTKKLLFKKLRR